MFNISSLLRSALESFNEKIVVRDIEERDLEQYVKLRNKVSLSSEYIHGTSTERAAEIFKLTRKMAGFKGAFSGKSLIGILIADFQDDGKGCYISNCFVDPDYRGNGAFSKLLESAVAPGVEYITLAVDEENKNAIEIYKHLGFILGKKHKVDDGEHPIYYYYDMRKEV